MVMNQLPKESASQLAVEFLKRLENTEKIKVSFVEMGMTFGLSGTLAPWHLVNDNGLNGLLWLWIQKAKSNQQI